VQAAFEFQVGVEQVDTPERLRALWMSAQAPVCVQVRGPVSVALRPEWTWDRDGRWIVGQLGAENNIAAFTTALEYRIARQRVTTLLRFEHRLDAARGAGAGFFAGGSHMPDVALVPRQQLLIAAADLQWTWR
jgi:hypothetical protein